MPESAQSRARSEAQGITAALRELGTPQRAVAERAYLKSDLVHFGTSLPNIRSVAKRFLNEHPGLTHDELIDVCLALWPLPPAPAPVHEQRAAAVELLDARPQLLRVADVDLIESWLRAAGTWALVDPLAGHVIGDLVVADDTLLAVLDRWVTDSDFWIRRAAVLGLGKVLREGRELDRFFAYADLLIDEREFFIRKVLGWVARDVARRQPAEISEWVRRNLGRMNGVTMREAVKYLPDGAELMTRWKARQLRGGGGSG